MVLGPSLSVRATSRLWRSTLSRDRGEAIRSRSCTVPVRRRHADDLLNKEDEGRLDFLATLMAKEYAVSNNRGSAVSPD
jgi:hypothetical protein